MKKKNIDPFFDIALAIIALFAIILLGYTIKSCNDFKKENPPHDTTSCQEMIEYHRSEGRNIKVY